MVTSATGCSSWRVRPDDAAPAVVEATTGRYTDTLSCPAARGGRLHPPDDARNPTWPELASDARLLPSSVIWRLLRPTPITPPAPVRRSGSGA
jgi:hypothetical protein